MKERNCSYINNRAFTFAYSHCAQFLPPIPRIHNNIPKCAAAAAAAVCLMYVLRASFLINPVIGDYYHGEQCTHSRAQNRTALAVILRLILIYLRIKTVLHLKRKEIGLKLCDYLHSLRIEMN